MEKIKQVGYYTVPKTGRKHEQIWLYKCFCGKEFISRPSKINNGERKSCGCLPRKNHDFYGTKFYATYHLIKQRCNNPKHPRYKGWGGRGIKCLWKSFEEFKSDMYDSFVIHNSMHGGRNTTIERINNDGNYCKENCCWATQREQSLNRRKKYLKNQREQ